MRGAADLYAGRMAEEHRWTYADASGQEMNPPDISDTGFPSRADAEDWLAQEWQEVAEAGVGSVTLWCGPDVVYGPMSLSP